MNKYVMYDVLLHACNYKPDCYYPSTRYSKTYGKDTELMNLKDAKILVDGHAYTPRDIRLDSDLDGTVITASAYLDPRNRCSYVFRKPLTDPIKPTITNVIFNPPATIVFWSDKSKTIVKADYDYESYDPEKGIAMAIAKKMMGDNKGSYYELFKHWRKKWDEQNRNESKVNTPKTPLNDLSEKIKSMFNIPNEVIIDDLVPEKEESNV